MAVILTKGQSINLKKEGSSPSAVMVGLGWDMARKENPSAKKGLFSSLFGNTSTGSSMEQIDCDASVFLLTNGKIADKSDIVYFGKKTHKSGAVKHSGDNLTGKGEGDDERIFVSLKQIPAEYDRVVFVVNIYNAVARRQHFGMIQNAFIRLVTTDDNKEICRYNLSGDYSNKMALILGEFYRENNEWKFKAVGEGTVDTSIQELSQRYL